MRVYENAVDKKILEEKRNLGGMRRNEAEKKIRSILYLALYGKRVLSQKHPRMKVLSISSKDFFNLLDAVFVKPVNTTF